MNDQTGSTFEEVFSNHEHGPGCGCSSHQQAGTFQRETPKVGRNDPCPCNSGKKFKKCCA
ncbi:SEC-C metal-binding domain-containing protein [Salinibius halmophilus]|uniref:SEC-C metal-binding domain-containing protein n=1 Tax=Salinibius halmophilus TaxID=1853216 RepID=UPI000E66DC23|nr:SEC-C metal-binding domain-containing protein [Salinibius halmophilus]